MNDNRSLTLTDNGASIGSIGVEALDAAESPVCAAAPALYEALLRARSDIQRSIGFNEVKGNQRTASDVIIDGWRATVKEIDAALAAAKPQT